MSECIHNKETCIVCNMSRLIHEQNFTDEQMKVVDNLWDLWEETSNDKCMLDGKVKQLEKENEELRAELKKVITHYQCLTIAVKDRLELSNCSDIELSDAYYILDLSETWLRDNYGHMKLDWF